MTVVSKSTLKTYFQTGDTPTQSNFEDLVDSTFNTISDAQANDLTDGGNTNLHGHEASGIDVDNTPFIVIESGNLQGALENVDLALLNARTTGIRTGGDLTINGTNSNQFDISPVSGQILDNSDPDNPLFYEVDYSAKTGLSAPDGINYIYYDISGDVVNLTQSIPTYQDRKTRLYIGRAVYRSGVLAGLTQDKDYIQQLGIQLRALADAIGQIQLSGIRISANGANLLMNLSAGVLFDFGVNGQDNPHEINITQKTGLTFQYVTQNSVITVDRTALDPANYDVNGVVTAMDNNKFQIQDVYVFASQNVRVAYGQNQYNSLTDAFNALNTRQFVPNPGLSLGLRVASIIIKKGSTSLQNTSDTLIYPRNKFGL